MSPENKDTLSSSTVDDDNNPETAHKDTSTSAENPTLLDPTSFLAHTIAQIDQAITQIDAQFPRLQHESTLASPDRYLLREVGDELIEARTDLFRVIEVLRATLRDLKPRESAAGAGASLQQRINAAFRAEERMRMRSNEAYRMRDRFRRLTAELLKVARQLERVRGERGEGGGSEREMGV